MFAGRIITLSYMQRNRLTWNPVYTTLEQKKGTHKCDTKLSLDEPSPLGGIWDPSFLGGGGAYLTGRLRHMASRAHISAGILFY